MANAAYWLSHPECPRQIDPNDPSHADCVAIWKRLRKRIDDRLAGKKKAPEKPPPPITPQDECDPLDPDSWGTGNICAHDGSRWVREPEEVLGGCSIADPSTWPDDAICQPDGKPVGRESLIGWSRRIEITVGPFTNTRASGLQYWEYVGMVSRLSLDHLGIGWQLLIGNAPRVRLTEYDSAAKKRVTLANVSLPDDEPERFRTVIFGQMWDKGWK
jgi:hypothetical protein